MSDGQRTNTANADQIAYWNAEAGSKWIAFQDGIDATFASVVGRLLEKAQPTAGERVLDVGCGSGATTRAFAERVGPGGRVVGIDIARQVLEHGEALRRASGLDQMELLLADAQTHGFTRDSFDLLVSRFGVMFFEDPVAAFANMAKALRPGARLVFASWSHEADNPWFVLPKQAAVARLGEPTPVAPRAPGPLAFVETDYVVDILARAGLIDCQGTTETVQLFNPAGVEAVSFLASNLGPAARIVREYEGTAEDTAAIGAEVTALFQPYVVEGGLSIPARLNFFQATKPTD